MKAREGERWRGREGERERERGREKETGRKGEREREEARGEGEWEQSVYLPAQVCGTPDCALGVCFSCPNHAHFPFG